MGIGNKNKILLNSDTTAALSLIIARIVYGINWFNIAAIFPFIASELNQGVSLLGSMTAAFFIGIGLFQIPAGIFAVRYNPRTSAIVGITICSAAALLCGLTSEASQLIWLRFVVGFGMAFFFSSAVILIATHGKRGFPGFSIGIMNSAHSMGGIIGIFAWIIIAQIVGWRASLVLSGVLGLITALVMIVTIPRGGTIARASIGGGSSNDKNHHIARQGKLRISDTIKVLSNRVLILLGLVLLGIQVAWGVEFTFLVVYMQNLGFSPEFTGITASLPLIFAIVSAPLFGGFYDKLSRLRSILLICGIGMSFAIAGLSLNSIYFLIPSVILTGFFSGGAFTVVYERARRVTIESTFDSTSHVSNQKEINRQGLPDERNIGSHATYYDALKVAWVNGLSLIGVLWVPIVFSYIAGQTSYELAWQIIALVTALLVVIPISKLSGSR